jgi:hypothetical protein
MSIWTKICSQCKESKYKDAFYKNIKSKDGLMSRCIECHRKLCKHKKRENLFSTVVYLPESKICTRCKLTKLKEEFHLNGNAGNGLSYWCKDCERDSRFQRSYGISEKEYKQLFNKQKGVCAICGQPETAKGPDGCIKLLSIDHDHTNNQIRGLLCTRCNFGIGYLNDDVKILTSALEYIIKHRVKED